MPLAPADEPGCTCLRPEYLGCGRRDLIEGERGRLYGNEDTKKGTKRGVPFGTVEGGTCQATERKRASDGKETAEGGTSQDRKKGLSSGNLPQNEQRARTRKESNRVRGTHELRTAEGGRIRTRKDEQGE